MNTTPSPDDPFAPQVSNHGSVPPLPIEELSAEKRWERESDLAGLRVREANLQAYEARLRAWQARLDVIAHAPLTSRSASPFSGSASPYGLPDEFDLRTAWEKLHRARALLEAEQKQVLAERLSARETKEELDRRTKGLDAREAALLERERKITAVAGADGKSTSAVRRITQAPFQAARAVFKVAK